jgi:glycosyltransferase involved in cell wall biosynthesis
MTELTDPAGARQSPGRRPWVVMHETGAPSHYAGLKAALAAEGIELEFVELNFLSQADAILRKRIKGQWRKTLANLGRLAGFALTGARGRHVVLGLAPYNLWILIVRWLLRNAQLSIHLSWPFWDGSRQPHEPLLPGVLGVWRDFMKHQVHHVLIATRAAAQSLQHSPYGGAPITVVAHSYDAGIFHPGPTLHERAQRCVYVGRLEPTKGIDLILRIAESQPQREFVFIGGGPLRGLLEEAAKRRANVRYLGIITDRSKLADVLRACQVLLLPSIRMPTWEEAFGMVLVEGMACGLVPLTTDHVGPIEVLGDRLASLCFSEADFVVGVSRQLERWDAAPAEFLAHQQAALKLAAPYTRDRIAHRWAVALGIGAGLAPPESSTERTLDAQAQMGEARSGEVHRGGAAVEQRPNNPRTGAEDRA